MKKSLEQRNAIFELVVSVFERLTEDVRKTPYFGYISMQFYYDKIAKETRLAPNTIRKYLADAGKSKRDTMKRSAKKRTV